jgi:hypothetical protein
MVLQSLIFQFRISEEQKFAGSAPANSKKDAGDIEDKVFDLDDDGVELF